MQIVEIELSRLVPHPLNSNRMPAELFEKLCAEIGSSGRYPPVIVRALEGTNTDTERKPAPPEMKGRACEEFQILDGHHRVAALRRLGHKAARCVVWEADDAEALALLAMLNRLQGRDDPRKRSLLVDALKRAQPDVAAAEEAMARLPETRAELGRLASVLRPPGALARPRELEQMPVSVHFFLLPTDARRVEARLSAMGPTREQALLRLCGGGGEETRETASVAGVARREGP